MFFFVKDFMDRFEELAVLEDSLEEVDEYVEDSIEDLEESDEVVPDSLDKVEDSVEIIQD